MPDRRRGPERILVIKLGALGDVVLSFEAFAAIRRQHPGAEITLLTTKPFVALAGASPWFDRVLVDAKPRWSDLAGWAALRRTLRGGGYGRVYDLQTSDRSGWYFRLFWPGPRPEWSGIAPGASHRDTSPDRARVHVSALRRQQLAVAGVTMDAPVALDWLDADLGRLALPVRFALLVPGSAPHRPDKRWPGFPALAAALAEQGLVPVVLGGTGERSLAAAMPGAADLTGRTSLLELAALGRRAALAVGNDTGPMHLIARVGCPSLVLFGAASDPAKIAPVGPAVRVLRVEALDELAPDAVLAALRPLSPGGPGGEGYETNRG